MNAFHRFYVYWCHMMVVVIFQMVAVIYINVASGYLSIVHANAQGWIAILMLTSRTYKQ